jgi:hypothetical protein
MTLPAEFGMQVVDEGPEASQQPKGQLEPRRI